MPAAISWGRSAASATAAVNSGTVDPDYPAANALDDDVTLVSKIASTSGGGTNTVEFELEWSASREIQLLAALNVKLPAGYPAACYVEIYDGTPTLIETTDSYAVADLVPIPGETDRYDLYWLLDAPVSARSVVFVFDSQTGIDNDVEIGRLWADRALVISEGVDANWRMQPIDDSYVARGGSGYAAQNVPVRCRLSAGLSVRDSESILGSAAAVTAASLRGVVMDVGRSRPIVAMLSNASNYLRQITGKYGLLVDLSEIGHAGPDRYSAEITLEQLR